MNKLNTSVIDRDGIAWEGEASKVSLPTKAGVITVLPKHAPIISSLQEGEIKVWMDEGEKTFQVRSGVLEVRPESKLVVLADIKKD